MCLHLKAWSSSSHITACTPQTEQKYIYSPVLLSSLKCLQCWAMSCFHILLAILNVAAFAPAYDVVFRFQVIGCVYPPPSPLRIFLWCEVQCRVINARYHEYQMAMMPHLSDHATQADLHVSEFCWVSGTWQWAPRCHLTRSNEPVCGRPQAEKFFHSVHWDALLCILCVFA